MRAGNFEPTSSGHAVLRCVVITLAAVLAVGCATPAQVTRCFVSEDLAVRTGCDLGSETAACDLVIPDFVFLDDGLAEYEAASLTLWNNPAYRELLVDLDISQADLIQAGQVTNPEITTMFPVGVKQWEFVLAVPLDVVLLRPRRVAAAQLENQRVAERLVQDGLNVIRDGRLAYIDAVLADQTHQLAEEGLRLRDEFARISQSRLDAGSVPELDVMAMRLEVLFNREQVVRTRRDVDIAREQLRFVLGLEMSEFQVTPTGLNEMSSIDVDADSLVAEALNARPDLRAVQFASVAACQRVELARRDYFNIWGLLPDINSAGKKGFEAGPGLRMNIPLFHQNQGAIARAVAEAERLDRQYARLQANVALEVRQAHTRLLAAEQQLHIWRKEVVPQAEAAVASSRQALEEDGVSLLLVIDTTRRLLDARLLELQAAADVHRALAELERAVGRAFVFEAPPAGVALPVS